MRRKYLLTTILILTMVMHTACGGKDDDTTKESITSLKDNQSQVSEQNSPTSDSTDEKDRDATDIVKTVPLSGSLDDGNYYDSYALVVPHTNGTIDNDAYDETGNLIASGTPFFIVDYTDTGDGYEIKADLLAFKYVDVETVQDFVERVLEKSSYEEHEDYNGDMAKTYYDFPDDTLAFDGHEYRVVECAEGLNMRLNVSLEREDGKRTYIYDVPSLGANSRDSIIGEFYGFRTYITTIENVEITIPYGSDFYIGDKQDDKYVLSTIQPDFNLVHFDENGNVSVITQICGNDFINKYQLDEEQTKVLWY